MSTQANALVPEQFVDAEQQHGAATLGMWAFLASEVLFFGVLFMSYFISRLLSYDGFAIGGQHTSLVLGSLNTALLLTSSLTMALAVRASTLGRSRATTLWLLLTLALGAVFLAIKGYEYHEDYVHGLVPFLHFTYAGAHVPEVTLFFYLYFVMTGLHALHLFIGLGVLAVMALLSHRGRFGPVYDTPIELTGFYWHFVDLVWIFLYPLFYLVARG
jgi:cytochrome c oxidase subunit 3